MLPKGIADVYILKSGWISSWTRKPLRIIQNIQPIEEFSELKAYGVLGRITVFGNIVLDYLVLLLFPGPFFMISVRSRISG